MRPRELPDIVDWLPANLSIVDKDSDYKGPFSWEAAPDLREIARSCVSPDIETTVIVGPTQSYKSTLLTGVAAYTIAVDHGPIGWVFGTTDIARAFSQTRIQPTIDGSPVLSALKPENPDHYKTLELGFRTCTVRLAGSNSPSNAATFSYKRVIGDEVDKYPALLGNESGTLDLLLLRTDQYTFHNHIFASSPTVPQGTIWRAALQGDCRRYHVPCPHCGREFVFEFSGLRWDPRARSARGHWDYARVAATAHYECPHCHGEIWENQRRDLLHAGRWIPDPVDLAENRRTEYDLRLDPHRRSYFRSCFNVLHPNRTFAAIAQKHLTAGDDPSARQNFTNGQLGEVYEPKSEKLAWEKIYERRETYLDGDNPERPAPGAVELPAGVLVLAAAVDAQANPARLELEIVGYGEGDESWGIQYKVIEGDPYDLATWIRLDEFLLYAWRHPAGHSMRPAVVCVDTGYATDVAYAYVQRCQPRRVLAVKGSRGGYGEPLADRPRKSGVDRVALWMVGTVTAKELIYARLQLQDAGPGYCHFPKNPKRGYDQAYFRGLTAEKVIWKYESGRKVKKFVPGEFKRNEPLDIRCYILAGLDVLRPDYRGIARRHDRQEELELSTDADTTPPPADSAVFDPATGKIEKPAAADSAPDAAGAGVAAEPIASAAQAPPSAAPEVATAPEVAVPVEPPAPAQAPRPAPNLALPPRLRHLGRRARSPRRAGYVNSWRH